MKQNNGWFETDVTKMMGDVRMPAVNMEALITLHRKNLEAMAAASQCSVEGMGTIVRRQGEIARETFEGLNKAVTDIFSAESVEQRAAKQAELAKSMFDRSVANGKELADLAVRTQNEAASMLTARISASFEECRSVVAADKTA